VAPAPDVSCSHLKPDHRNRLPLLPWKAQGSPVDLELGTNLRDALAWDWHRWRHDRPSPAQDYQRYMKAKTLSESIYLSLLAMALN
jgi:hypothetical protein